MTVTCVYVRVKEEHIDDFIEATTRNHLGSVREPGNLRFDVIQSVENPGAFLLYEAYESAEAAAAHKDTDWLDFSRGNSLAARPNLTTSGAVTYNCSGSIPASGWT